MAYNNVTSRTDAAALIPEEVYREMMGKATEESAVLNLFRPIPVARAQTRIPVLSALPTAYFVTGDTGLKQTTEVNWTNKFLNVEEIAAIMPVPDNVVADVEQDIWDTAMPLLVEAFYRTLDAAVFFGTNAPSSWPTNLASAATAAGNAVTASSVATAGAFFGDLDNAYEKVETDGYSVTGFVGATSVKSRLRKSRDSQGRKLDESRVGGSLTSIDGLPIVYPMRGMFGTSSGSPTLFAGDFSQFVVGVRQDITMKVLDQAVIQDNTGAIVYNLAQQDMTAIRLTFRVGWQVANTINNEQPTEANRYPVARIDLP
jgi:HK97 family phage major capsid protein